MLILLRFRLHDLVLHILYVRNVGDALPERVTRILRGELHAKVKLKLLLANLERIISKACWFLQRYVSILPMMLILRTVRRIHVEALDLL